MDAAAAACSRLEDSRRALADRDPTAALVALAPLVGPYADLPAYTRDASATLCRAALTAWGADPALASAPSADPISLASTAAKVSACAGSWSPPAEVARAQSIADADASVATIATGPKKIATSELHAAIDSYGALAPTRAPLLAGAYAVVKARCESQVLADPAGTLKDDASLTTWRAVGGHLAAVEAVIKSGDVSARVLHVVDAREREMRAARDAYWALVGTPTGANEAGEKLPDPWQRKALDTARDLGIAKLRVRWVRDGWGKVETAEFKGELVACKVGGLSGASRQANSVDQNAALARTVVQERIPDQSTLYRLAKALTPNSYAGTSEMHLTNARGQTLSAYLHHEDYGAVSSSALFLDYRPITAGVEIGGVEVPVVPPLRIKEWDAYFASLRVCP